MLGELYRVICDTTENKKWINGMVGFVRIFIISALNDPNIFEGASFTDWFKFHQPFESRFHTYIIYTSSGMKAGGLPQLF